MTDLIDRTMNYLSTRKTAYQLAFGSPAGNRVLEDLTVFCKVLDTGYDSDPLVMARNEGRREVMLRIQKHCNLTPEQLFDIYNGRSVLKGDTK